MLKPSLQVRLGQQLTMTPQLQQAIRLLQLSSLELKTEIQEAFETNPMLETEDEDQTEAEPNNTEELALDKDSFDTEEISGKETLPDDLPVDSEWEDVFEPVYTTPSSSSADDHSDYLENQSTDEHGSLQEHLLWQLELSTLSDVDRIIAATIIDSLDQSGYLQEDIENIHKNLKLESDLELDEVEAVLKYIQRLDPLGSGSRSLKECLDIQLQQITQDTPHLDAARVIVEHHLDLVGNKDYKKIAKLSQLDNDEIEFAIRLIQSLNPRPGDLINSQAAEYISPDVYVYKQNGTWKVRLNHESAPKLRINDTYSNYIQNSKNSAETDYLRNQLQEARWFIKSLQSRNETLMRVATSIVRHQRSFFEYGEEAMRPLVLRDIAEELEMHESTISRVTTNKYLDCSRGVFEFKYFFSSHVNTNDGGICSATAIRAMIKKLIQAENQAKPLSDNKIANFLEQKGISVARRTIAKYRESMSIPPSNERKKMS